jgi:hypothetical protein
MEHYVCRCDARRTKEFALAWGLLQVILQEVEMVLHFGISVGGINFAGDAASDGLQEEGHGCGPDTLCNETDNERREKTALRVVHQELTLLVGHVWAAKYGCITTYLVPHPLVRLGSELTLFPLRIPFRYHVRTKVIADVVQNGLALGQNDLILFSSYSTASPKTGFVSPLFRIRQG